MFANYGPDVNLETFGLYGQSAEAPPNEENQVPAVGKFWESVIAFEQAPHTTHFEQLLAHGVSLPDPSELSEEGLEEKLSEVIQNLAQMRVYLRNTNHLSDRQLYELLWWDLLRQETVDTSNLPGTNCQLDLIGSGSDEDQYLYLTYYADESERRFWNEQFPDSELPSHVDPPFQRDQDLPRPA